MKNVTITVEDSVLEWARIEAARRGTSVSRMVGDFMAEMQRREDAYERAYLAWRTDERTWHTTIGMGALPSQPDTAAKKSRHIGLQRTRVVWSGTSEEHP